jgi:hypothetical protein
MTKSKEELTQELQKLICEKLMEIVVDENIFVVLQPSKDDTVLFGIGEYKGPGNISLY